MLSMEGHTLIMNINREWLRRKEMILKRIFDKILEPEKIWPSSSNTHQIRTKREVIYRKKLKKYLKPKKSLKWYDKKMIRYRVYDKKLVPNQYHSKNLP